MQRIKKVITILIATVICFTVGSTAIAAETNNYSSVDTSDSSRSGNITNYNLLERLDEMKLGETKIIGYIDNEPLKMTLISSDTDSITRGTAKTARHLYSINYDGKKVIEVTLTASYFVDGFYEDNNRMLNLNGVYKIINNNFSCRWDTSQSVATDYYHELPLVISRFGQQMAEIRYQAWVDFTLSGGVTFYSNSY